MDWFKPTKPGQRQACELRQEIQTLRSALRKGGSAYFRSAAIEPWYVELFREEGFVVEPLQQRPVRGKQPIDGVNMYASFWRARKA